MTPPDIERIEDAFRVFQQSSDLTYSALETALEIHRARTRQEFAVMKDSIFAAVGVKRNRDEIPLLEENQRPTRQRNSEALTLNDPRTSTNEVSEQSRNSHRSQPHLQSEALALNDGEKLLIEQSAQLIGGRCPEPHVESETLDWNDANSALEQSAQLEENCRSEPRWERSTISIIEHQNAYELNLNNLDCSELRRIEMEIIHDFDEKNTVLTGAAQIVKYGIQNLLHLAPAQMKLGEEELVISVDNLLVLRRVFEKTDTRSCSSFCGAELSRSMAKEVICKTQRNSRRLSL